MASQSVRWEPRPMSEAVRFEFRTRWDPRRASQSVRWEPRPMSEAVRFEFRAKAAKDR